MKRTTLFRVSPTNTSGGASATTVAAWAVSSCSMSVTSAPRCVSGGDGCEAIARQVDDADFAGECERMLENDFASSRLMGPANTEPNRGGSVLPSSWRVSLRRSSNASG